MAILSKACEPNNFESHNSLKLSFTNIRGLCSNFVDCESFLELWNSLSLECFPLTYDLSGFKSGINRHLLTVGSF